MDNTSSDILLAVFAFVSFACFCPYLFFLEFCCHVKTVKFMLSRSDNRLTLTPCLCRFNPLSGKQVLYAYIIVSN